MENLFATWEANGMVYLPQLLQVLFVLFLAFLVLRVLKRRCAPFFWLARIAVWSIALLFILSNLGYNVSSLIAGLGIGGIAIALAAQETLSNAFGYLSILMDKPFKIGDEISVDKFSGTVKSMGLRSTRLQKKNGVIVYIPNKTMASMPIENCSKKSKD